MTAVLHNTAVPASAPLGVRKEEEEGEMYNIFQFSSETRLQSVTITPALCSTHNGLAIYIIYSIYFLHLLNIFCIIFLNKILYTASPL